MSIKIVPNQKVVTINKQQCGKGQIYTTINLNAMQIAIKELTPNTFKLWCYLSKNQDKYTFPLSREYITQYCNFSKNTYTNAVNNLIDKGFLIKSNKQSSHYIFDQLPEKYKNQK